MNFEFLKITAPIVFNQRFEPGTLGSESQCSSTAPSLDLYVESGDNIVNAKRQGKGNSSKHPSTPLPKQQQAMPLVLCVCMQI